MGKLINKGVVKLGERGRSAGAIITGANLRPKKTSQLKRLTLEEQRALGIDTGPVLYVSSVPRRPKPTELPKPPKEEA